MHAIILIIKICREHLDSRIFIEVERVVMVVIIQCYKILSFDGLWHYKLRKENAK